VSKISADGTQLLYSTFLGGSGNSNGGDNPAGIAVDSQGDAYIAGTTFSTDFPVPANALQPQNNASTIGGSNLFVAKLNAEGTGLLYSTYLGGSGFQDGCCDYANGWDYGTAVAVDSSGSAYIVGYSHSKDYPVTTGAFQTTNAAISENGGFGSTHSNAVITKLDPTGLKKVYSSYLGGGVNSSHGDGALGVAVNDSGEAYITGIAASQDFPIAGGALFNNCNPDGNSICGFVTKLNSTGSHLAYSTLLGGPVPSGGRYGDYTSSIAIDAQGDAYVTGITYSLNFPVTPGAYQKQNNEQQSGGANYYSGNAFLTELNPAGNDLVYSTYLGGSGSNAAGGDYGLAIAVDANNNAYIAGQTYSSNFPGTASFYQPTNAAQAAGNKSSSNAFVAKFGEQSQHTLIETSTTVSSSAPSETQGQAVSFTVNVKPAKGGQSPSGTIGLSIDGGPVNFLTLGGTGNVTYETSALSPTQHTISANYYGDVFFSSSTGTVTQTIVGVPATVIVSPDKAQSCTYGSACDDPLIVKVEDSLGNPVKSAKVTFASSGLAFNPATVTTGANGQASTTLTATASGQVAGSVTAAGLAQASPFTVAVKQAPLMITANNATANFGGSLPIFTFTAKGFLLGDTVSVLSGEPSENASAKQGSNAGKYTILIAQGTLKAANYTFTFQNGVLTITPVGKSSTPTISPASGTYYSVQPVTISDPIAGALVFYTTDGTTPTATSTKYTAPIVVASSEKIQAIATIPNENISSIVGASYKIVGSPTALSAAASAISTPDATLNAVVSTNDVAGSYYFQYGTSSTSLTSTTPKTAVVASSSAVAASAKLTSLAPKTTYYFQPVITTAGGTAFGSILSFTTN
jgi:hypothetical protein